MLQNRKSLGQHWLTDRSILDQIADLAVVDGVSTCLEIGPGLGTLTSSLLRRFSQVTAVELDSKLAHNLPSSFPGKNLTVINTDFLDFDLDKMGKKYVVSANIPYYITSPIISKLLSAPHPPAKIVLLVQKEVAERIVAANHQHSLLSLTIENRAQPSLHFIVPRVLFTPPPKVDSAVISLTLRSAPLVADSTLALAQKAFSAPRKKALNNLAAFYPKAVLIDIFTTLGFNLSARPANFTLNDWQNIENMVKTLPKSK